METAQEYQVDLDWREDQHATISSILCQGSIEMASHSCLKDVKDQMWSAEHLFLAGIEGAIMATFFKTAESRAIRYVSYKSSARASIVIGAHCPEITDIVIRITVIICNRKDISKTLKIFSTCKENNMILNALKIRMHIFPTVIVER